MSTLIHIKHPLRSNGSSQLSRLVKALATNHFQLDERSSQDLINAAYEYARMLRYHGPDRPAGDHWACFWEIENLTYMAILAAMDTDQIRRDYEKIDMEFGLALEGQPSKKGKKTNLEIEGQYYRRLLRYTRDTARKLERHYETLREDIPLKGELLTLIRRDNDKRYEPDDIEGALQQLIAWHKAWDDGLRPEAYRAFLQADHRWGVRNRDEYDCILPDESLSDRDEIRGLFLRFFNNLLAIKARAQKLFDEESARLELPESQETRPLAPHIALFISFLHLFRHAQESLNEIPDRHLDFYYEQVLCLERRPATPDHAYLIFTLAKEFNDELIEQGTAVLAGKDKNGQPIKFRTLEKWKVTKAQVAELKGLNWGKSDNRLKVSALSGKETAQSAKAIRAFADETTAIDTNLGFAIASPQLILKEGLRTINVRFKTTSVVTPEFASTDSITAVWLTTDEGWKKITSDAAVSQPKYAVSLINEDSQEFAVSITLPRDFSPVVKLESYDKQFGFGPTEWPMMLVQIAPLQVNEMAIEEILIKVAVSDIRENLIIQTDQGVFDGTQTVYPFSPIPKIGNRFYLGSTEVFQKALSLLNVRFKWIAPPINPPGFKEYYKGYKGYDSNIFPYLKFEFVDKATELEPGVGFQISRQGTLTNDTVQIRVSTSDGTDVSQISVMLNGAAPATLIDINDEGFFEFPISPSENRSTLWLYVTDAEGRYKTVYFPLSKDGVATESFSIVMTPKNVETGVWASKELTVKVQNEVAAGDSLSISLDGGTTFTQHSSKSGQTFNFLVDEIPAKFLLRFKTFPHLEIEPLHFTNFNVFFAEAGPVLVPKTDANRDEKLNISFVGFDKTKLTYAGIPVKINERLYHTNDDGEVSLSGIEPETIWAISPIVHPLFQQNVGAISGTGATDVTITLWPIQTSYVIKELSFENIQLTPLDYDDNTELRLYTSEGVFFALSEAIEDDASKRMVLLPKPQFNSVLIIRARNFQVSGLDFTHTQGDNWYVPDPNNQDNSLIKVRLYEKITRFSMVQNGLTLQDNFDVNISSLNLKRDHRTQFFEKYTPTIKRGFLRMVLEQNDFLHTEYIKLLADPDIAKTINPPYTPSTNGISVDYESTQSIVVENNGIDKFYLIHPFGGYEEVGINQPKNPVPLTPSFYPNTLVNNLGSLFIGLQDLNPGDNISLLVQLEEGSEQNFESLPPKVEWFYLSNNEWKPLNAEKIIRDGSNMLTQSGIIQLAVPGDATKDNTILDAQYHWLSAKVVEGSGELVGAFASIKSIRAQAIEAAFAPEKLSYLNRLNEPLPASTLSKLEFSRSAVKKIEQPFATFGGRNPETDPDEYRRRVSERLRHKDRAVTAWDYEHLLLEQYSQVAVVKCIPHTRYEKSGAYTQPSELAPGFVTVAVIPDLQQRPNMVREEPRFARGDLYEMRDALLPKCNLFLQPIPAEPSDASDEDDHFLQVVNPQYEPVHIALSVWLKRGADQNLAIYKINEALRNHLAPWLSDAGKGPTFGREIRRSKLIQLVEEMEDVDVVKWLKIFQVVLPDGEQYPVSTKADGLLVVDKDPLGSSNSPNLIIDGAWEPYEEKGSLIRPNTARSVLTTAKEHQILILGGKGGDVQRDDAGNPIVPQSAPIPVIAPRKVSAPPVAALESKKEATTPPQPTLKSQAATAPKTAAKSKSSNSKRK